MQSATKKSVTNVAIVCIAILVVFLAAYMGFRAAIHDMVRIKGIRIVNKHDAYKLLFDKYGQYFEVHTYTGRHIPPMTLKDYGRQKSRKI